MPKKNPPIKPKITRWLITEGTPNYLTTLLNSTAPAPYIQATHLKSDGEHLILVVGFYD